LPYVLKRAQTVANFLISQGVNPNLVRTRGLGDADPVAPNDTPQGAGPEPPGTSAG
jgi:peptidoglycan-binding protein ArfA